ncbi:hypothetical protein ACTWQB_00955 [Piscibacillus sp. B03]|uniref:hypothetical protein n=1 Tax=Piscibacillus sp. B03 TaxID=3457430 RepID=UPI003FCDA875
MMKQNAFIVPGCTLLGIGLGLLFDEVAAGTLIGIGLGLLLSGASGKWLFGKR